MRTLTLILLAASAMFAQKRSVMVEAFDYSTVLTASQAIFGTQVPIGEGIRALMVQRIAAGGRLTVVERKKVDTLMKEQDFGASGRVARGSAARIGRIRGADLTLMGDIVVFGRDDRRRSGAAGVIVGGVGGAARGYQQEDKAVVVLNYRLADTETSEIVLTGEARGESKRVSKGALAASSSAAGSAPAGLSICARPNFAETIIGEATIDAVNQLCAQLNGQTNPGGLADSRTDDLDARVASFANGSLIINAGANAGLSPGQTFTVYRKGEEVKDPVTGEVLDVQTDRIGTMTITTVRERIAIGTYQGAQPPRAGDVVRK
jgi:curli biogenesis system outer membrane secretion channel CsgG